MRKFIATQYDRAGAFKDQRVIYAYSQSQAETMANQWSTGGSVTVSEVQERD